MSFDEYKVVNTEFVPRPDLTGTTLSPALRQAHIQSLLFNSYNTLLRTESLIDNIKRGLKSTPVSLKYLSGLIESIIIKLLTSSYITNKDATFLSPHYHKYQEKVVRKDVPYDVSKVITYGYSYMWGGLYGTPLYYNYLSKNLDHYQNPANLAHIVYSYFFKKIRQNSIDSIYTPKLPSLIDDLFLNGINNTEMVGDNLIYHFHKNFLYSFPYYSSMVRGVSSLIQIKDILDYNWDYYKDNKIIKELYLHIVNQGVGSLTKLNNKIPHLDLSHSTINAIVNASGMLEILRLNTQYPDIYEIISSNNIDTFKPLSYLSIFESLLLNLIPGPGGFNELLVMLSLVLLVRAFSICHVDNSGVYGNIPFSKLNKYDSLSAEGSTSLNPNLGGISSHILNRSKVEELFYRTNRLIYLSGVLLRKTNLFDLNILGNNISSVSGYKDTSPIRLDINT